MENMSAWGMGNKENERDLRMKTKAGREEKKEKMKKKERKKSGSSKKNHRRESRHVGATDYFNPVQVENSSDVVGRVSHTHTEFQSDQTFLQQRT